MKAPLGGSNGVFFLNRSKGCRNVETASPSCQEQFDRRKLRSHHFWRGSWISKIAKSVELFLIIIVYYDLYRQSPGFGLSAPCGARRKYPCKR